MPSRPSTELNAIEHAPRPIPFPCVRLWVESDLESDSSGMHNLRLRGIHAKPTITRDLVDRAQNRDFQLMLPPCIRPMTSLTNSTATTPPRKGVALADGGYYGMRGHPTTGSVRSIAKFASRGMGVAASSNPTTDGTTASKPASKAKINVAPKPNPASKTTKPPGGAGAGAGHTGAGAGDDGDNVPASRRPVDPTTKDDKKTVVSMSCQQFARADLCVKASVVRLERGVAPVDPHSGMVGQCSTNWICLPLIPE